MVFAHVTVLVTMITTLLTYFGVYHTLKKRVSVLQSSVSETAQVFLPHVRSECETAIALK